MYYINVSIAYFMYRNISWPSDEDLEGINEDRKRVIEIIRILHDSRKLSVSQILQGLEYPNLPNNKHSKVIISRIIHVEPNNKNNDNTSGIVHSKLCSLLEEKFERYITAQETGTIETKPFGQDKIQQHDDYYIYYYESYDENELKYYVKFALVGLNNDSEKNEWGTGTIYYFTDNSIHKIFDLVRMEPRITNLDALFFLAYFERQVNFFTIKINNREKNIRRILPLTYSVLETQFSYPCAGKGILERIDGDSHEQRVINYSSKITDLIRDGIDDTMINILYLKKFVLDEPVFDKKTPFINKQTELLKKFNGIWEGVYLRNDFEEVHKSSKEHKGGLCKFALHIEASGKCELHYNQIEDEIKHCYHGFIEFPFNDNSIMKISLEYGLKQSTYRIAIYMAAGSIGKTQITFGGVITGWTNANKQIYSSAIYMKPNNLSKKKLSKQEVEETIRRIAPKRIPKMVIEKKLQENTNDVNSLRQLGLEPDFIYALKQLEAEHLSKISTCLPPALKDIEEIS